MPQKNANLCHCSTMRTSRFTICCIIQHLNCEKWSNNKTILVANPNDFKFCEYMKSSSYPTPTTPCCANKLIENYVTIGRERSTISQIAIKSQTHSIQIN